MQRMSEVFKNIDRALDVSLQMGLTENFETNDTVIDWRRGISKAYEERDIVKMKQDQAIAAQYALNELAHEADSESVRADTLKFILGQAGHGVIQKVDHTMDYHRMPDIQLRTLIQSKLIEIKRKNPNFDVMALLPKLSAPAIEVECQDGVYAQTTVDQIEGNLVVEDE